ncbi:MAG: radical SAM protein [bacterium]
MSTFRCLRIQILQPCQGRCRYCATHKKNRVFADLNREGHADQVHRFYRDVVAHFKPQELFVSGGEPILLPGIGRLMADMAPHVSRIHFFTSYQYGAKRRQRLDLEGMPWDKVVLTHTILYFHAQQWEHMSQGFPFPVYVENMKELAKLAQRKCYKFILNHPNAPEELAAFLDEIQPDESSTLRWKLMNQQGGQGFNVAEISKSRSEVRERLERWQEVVTEFRKRAKIPVDEHITGAEVLAGATGQADVESCPFRSRPEELRFAFYRIKGGVPLLQYRFCPHFPSRFRYIHRVGQDTFESIQAAYSEGEYHRHCKRCRLQLYTAA